MFWRRDLSFIMFFPQSNTPTISCFLSQTFQIVKPKLGLTRVYDLSSEDMKKIGYFALIELTTFYDGMGIEMKRNRVVRSKTRGQ